MKRKSLTIVSIVSIIIISLLLLGLTYGYYLTNIEGNTNSKSVEVTTGDSRVTYTDLSTNDTSEIIEPGFKTVKTFTVQNTGEVSATYSIYLVDVINDFNRTQDITYNLYKKQGTITDVTIETDLSSWTRVNEEVNKEFPTEMSVIASNETIQNPNDIYTYVLKVEYYNHPTENQNEDQGKTLAFKVNLRAEDSYTNPFSEGTLAYQMYKRAENVTEAESEANGYAILGNPKTTPGTDYSLENEAVLASTQDDYGTSYYYRGSVKDNYVNYSGMCWRIVRTDGKGNIKLILADGNNECDSNEFDINEFTSAIKTNGYNNCMSPSETEDESKICSLEDTFYENSNIPSELDTWSKRSEKPLDTSGLVLDATWCQDSSIISSNEHTTSFGVNTRLFNNNLTGPTLKCNMTGINGSSAKRIESYIGLLTADEVSLAGIVYVFGGDISSNPNYAPYLIDNLKDEEKEYFFWTMTPGEYDEYDNKLNELFVVSYVNSYGYVAIFPENIKNVESSGNFYIQPSILIKSTASVTTKDISNGQPGTYTNPYVIN